MELRDAIRKNPMTGYQWSVVVLCILLTVVDGYEILIAAFTLPALTREWGLTIPQQGLVASIGTLGMGVGAAALGPLADRIGRRKHIIASMIFIVIGMTLSGLAPSFTAFLVFRFFAGLFLGGIVPSINVLVSEYANDKRRGTVMGVYGIGFSLGSATGGFLSVWLIGNWGWQGPYFFSAICTALLLVWCIFSLPESVGYLVEKRPKGAVAAYSKISERVGLGPDDTLPPPTSAALKPSLGKDMWRGIMLQRTLLLWISYALMIAAFYFANSWTARLVAQSTGNENVGITAQALISVGGVISAFIFATMALKLHPRIVTSILMVYGFFAYVAFANFFENTAMVFVLAVLVGIAANGGTVAFYAISPPIYPTSIRASAVGLMMGFGRIIAFLAPNIAAAMLAAGLTPPQLFQVFGVVLFLSGVVVYFLHRTYRGDNALDAMEIETAVGVRLDEEEVAEATPDRR